MAKEMLEIYLARKKIGKEQQKVIRDIYNLHNWQQAWKEAIKQEKV